ncbi:MAG: hypothetical protein RIS70_2625 [Planctomycetota bacterium]
MFLACWNLRKKLVIGSVVLLAIVSLLAFSSFRGAYSYRRLVRSISHRANELPLAGDLAKNVTDLQLVASRIGQRRAASGGPSVTILDERQLFRTRLAAVHAALNQYREQLESAGPSDLLFEDNHMEFTTLAAIEMHLKLLDDRTGPELWIHPDLELGFVNDQLDHISDLCSELPSNLHTRLSAFAGEVRGQYRTWIILNWITTIASVAGLGGLIAYLYLSIFGPLRRLIADSRRITSGNFGHRVSLHTRDEIAELGASMNDMTERFQSIRDNLDQKVRERTQELEERTQQLVQSEQLASVGFLAAGVAHEINNPLASIAWCAESLESRVADILADHSSSESAEQDPEIGILQKYLNRIQSEAFRCKGITEKLLDFSRLGNSKKEEVDLTALIEDVIQIVSTIGSYRDRTIELHAAPGVCAEVNGPEIKQVVLNLLTNALDSLAPNDESGKVIVSLSDRESEVELTVADNGCGMTEEVRDNLFKPFFTRRQNGQGTGLGLSITHRIVDEHRGIIQPHSDGPGSGSTMTVRIPRKAMETAHEDYERKAA